MANLSVSMTDLSDSIKSSVSTIVHSLDANSLPHPSFHVDGPSALPPLPDVQSARINLIDAASKLILLATGPEDSTFRQCFTPRYDAFILGILNRYNVFEAVPLSGSIAYKDLAATVGLSEDRVHRFVRYAMTISLFHEPKPGYVAHTSFSAATVRKPILKAMIAHCFEEAGESLAKVPEAIDRYGDSPLGAESGAGIAYGLQGDETIWTFLERDGEGPRKGWRMKRFADAMRSATTGELSTVSYVHDALDWGSIGEGIVVDVGGNTGHISVELAKAHPHLQIIVQDLPQLQTEFDAKLPVELKPRVSFQPHNFFQPQPVKAADVYYMRLILHDWSDELAVKIVRQIVTVMKPSSRIVLTENVIPPPGGVPAPILHMMLAADMQMMACCNSKERTRDEWVELMKTADSRLTLGSISQLPGNAFTTLEFVLS